MKTIDQKNFRHELGTSSEKDTLIFYEKTDAFTVSIGLSADEKYYFITSSDHNTSEQYYFDVNEKPIPKLIQKRDKGVLYNVNSWDGYFYMHTNKNAEDFKINRSKNIHTNKWETFIPAKNETLIGSLTFLKNWIIRSEVTNALGKLFVKT